MAAITNFLRTVTYRGGEGQLAWMLHRLAGVGVFFFLLLHIIDIFLMAFGPEVFDALLFFYHQWVFKLAIAFGLYPAVVYHGLNGIRIIMIDFWPDLGERQAQLFRGQIIVFLVIYIPSAIIMLTKMFGPHA